MIPEGQRKEERITRERDESKYDRLKEWGVS